MNRANRPRLSRISGSSYASRLMSRAGDGSTLTLDFTTGILDPRLSFTRLSNATFINSSGLVQYADANVLIRSQEYTNAAWAKIRIDTSATGLNVANTTTAPDGSNTGLLLRADSASGSHRILQSNGTTGATYLSTAGGAITPVTLSAYFKANGSDYCALKISNNVESRGVTRTFNLTNGVVSGAEDTGWSLVSAAATPVGSGWYRCEITVSLTRVDANDDLMGIWLWVANGPDVVDRSFTNSAASVWVWGAQVSIGANALEYRATTTVPYQAPRFDHDPTTLAPRGLLIEGQSVNALKYSEQINTAPWFTFSASIAVNDGVAPDGNTTADSITPSGLPGGVFCNDSFAAGTWTFSIWAKANPGNTLTISIDNGGNGRAVAITLSTATAGTPFIRGTGGTVSSLTVNSVTVFPNSWRRISVTVVTTGANFVAMYNPNDTNKILVWGAQLEAGSGASSYIPTGASTATRAVDYCTMPTSSFITGNPYPNTLFVDCIPATANSGFPNMVRLFDQTGGGTFSYGNEIYYYNAASMTTQRKISASPNTDRNFANGLAYNTQHKFATAIDSSSFIGSYDGVTGLGSTTAPAALASVVTHLGVGNSGGSTAVNVMNGCIRQIKFWPTALPQATLNALTTL